MGHDAHYSEAALNDASSRHLARTRFGLATALVILVLVGLTMATWWFVNSKITQAHDQLLQIAERDTQNMVRLFHEHTQRTLESADETLRLLATAIVSSPKSARHLVESATPIGETFNRLMYFDANGILVATTDRIREKLDITDREYFQRLKGAPSANMLVSKPVKARTNGKLAVPLARRVTLEDGSFGGIVLASLNPDYLLRYFASINLGDHGTVALVNMEGTVYARRDPSDLGTSSTGKTYKLGVLKYAQQKDIGTYRGKSNIDNVTRIVSFQTIPEHDLILFVALSEADLASQLADSERHWILAGTIFTALLVMLSMISIYVIRTANLNNRRMSTALELERTNARTDPLTGLGNRLHLESALAHQLSQLQRYGVHFSLAYFDCDNFKQINDRLGHDIGDRCLVAVAKAARKAIRECDGAFRIGGDEFAIVFPMTAAPEALLPLERIRASLSDYAKDMLHPVTLSIGLVEFQAAPEGTDEALKNADQLMYEAKRSGGDRIVHKVLGHAGKDATQMPRAPQLVLAAAKPSLPL